MRKMIVMLLAFKLLLYTTYSVTCLIDITSFNPYNSAILFKNFHSLLSNEQAETLGVSVNLFKGIQVVNGQARR